MTFKSGRDIAATARRHNLTFLQRLGSTATWRMATSGREDELRRAHLLREDPDVEDSEPNYLYFAPETLQQSFAFVDQQSFAFVDGESPAQFFRQTELLRIEASEAHEYSTGRGIVIAVVDTGVDQYHPLLQGRLVSGWDFVNGDSQPQEEPGGGAYGHGTFVAGILALIAPRATIMPLRALQATGSGDAFRIAQAIWFAAERNAHVLNLSLGMTKPSHVINTALEHANSRGLVIIAAAGNANQIRPQSPARNKLALAVAAVDDDDRKANFSNYGPYIGISAPGVRLYSAYPNGRFATWSGTSFSTAIIAGAAALVRSLSPSMRPRSVIGILEQSAEDIDDLNPQYQGKLGEGRINCRRAVRIR